jgi:hypothetical protein
MKRLILASALAALLCSPALAESGPRLGSGHKAQSSDHPAHARRGHRNGHHAPHRAFGAVTPFGSPTAEPMDAGREAAIRDCNAQAAKTYQIRDSNWPILMYRACMAQHGQPE